MKTHILKSVVSTLFFMLLSITIHAQFGGGGGGGSASATINGSTIVTVNDVSNYTATVSGATVYAANWTINGGGIIQSQNNNSTSIQWTSAGVHIITYTVTSSSAGFIQATLLVNVNAAPAPPENPTAPTISSQNCSSATLQRTNPPSGVTWYWQGTNSTGTSTSNSATSYTVTSSGTYYIRARNNSGIWSSGSASMQVTLGSIGGSVWYADSDGDGLGDPNSSTVYCTQPLGYVANSNDQCPNQNGQGNSNGCATGNGLSNDNYIHTITPQIAVDNVSQITNEADVIENITYFDGLGRTKQSIGIRAGADKLKNNLIDWENSWTLGSGSAEFFGQNGSTSENERVNGIDPYGNTSMLWKCGNDSANDADGGWNMSYFTIDNTVGYQYTTWVKRTGSQDGYTYHGTHNVNSLSGTPNVNPYFWYGDLPQLDQWYLLVGVIHPHDYTGGYSGISGVYDTNGNKVLSGTDFKWDSTTTNTNFRSYLFYATDTNVRQYFYDPIVQKRDGNHASIQDLVAGHTGKDLISHAEYDAYGRQQKEYLPYAPTQTGNSGEYRTDAVAQTNTYYTTNYASDLNISAPNPYSETQFEASPLNRPLKQAAPGEDWKMGGGHEVEFAYESNTASEVKNYEVTLSFANNTYTPTLVDDGYYTAGELYKTITRDENHSGGNLVKNHTTEEFKDKMDRVILKRTYADINGVPTAHDTYYVYDDLGNLSFVLPPKAEAHSAKPDAAELSELCYQYIYDNRSRLVEKKIPGKDWEYIIYNKLDQPVMTQDANLRLSNEWLFTKYDAFGRAAYTGIHIQPSNTSRVTMQGYADSTSSFTQFVTKTNTANNVGGVAYYYTNDAIPTGIADIYTINYYDNYTFDKDGLTLPSSIYGQTIATNTQGLATGSKVRVLGTNHWITTLTGYDVKGRPIYVISKNNYLGTTDIVESKLDFAGKVIETTTRHTYINDTRPTIVTIDNFYYDHAARLVKQTQKIGNQQTQEIIVKNSYDEIGQLIGKGVGSRWHVRLQDVDYKYNIRGWLKSINDVNNIGNDLFSFSINYNDPNTGTALYNGNISQTHWKTANTDASLKTYTYGYDDLNRITSGTDNTGNYNLSNMSYDKNGNILTLNRAGHTNAAATTFGSNMDILTYAYDGVGNKLKSVNDSGHETLGFTELANTSTEYTYDANGNMITDANKGITGISYNHLNLPTTVTINGNNINYIYDATGVKLRKTANGTTTDYAGNYVYENSSLKFFNHPEGYVEPASNTVYKYAYQFKDHLGNIRLSYGDSNVNGSITAPISEVFNDGFESASGWGDSNTSGDLVYDSAFKYSGEYSGRIDKPTSGEKYFSKDTWTAINNTSDTEYTFSGWVYSDNPSVDIYLFKRDGTTITFDYVRTFVKNQWIYIEKTITVASNIDELKLRIDNNGSGTVWFDNVSIKKVNDITLSEIIEENNYYPFGLKHKGYNNVINGTDHKYGFGGKEEQDELGLGWIDITARNYDPALGRWMNLDPLAEEMRRHSPYNYSFDNPVFYIDADGMAPNDAVTGAYGESLVDSANTNYISDYSIFDTIGTNGKENSANTSVNAEGDNVIQSSNSSGNDGGNGGGDCPECSLLQKIARFFGFDSGARNRTEKAGDSGDKKAIQRALDELDENSTNLQRSADDIKFIAEILSTVEPSGVSGIFYEYTLGDSNVNKGLAILAIVPFSKLAKGAEIISFVQKGKTVNAILPKGFKQVPRQFVEKQKVYTNGKIFISPDAYGHNGGVWKAAKSVRALRNKSTRSGTYDVIFQRIGD